MADLIKLEQCIWQDRESLKARLNEYRSIAVDYSIKEGVYLSTLNNTMDKLTEEKYSVTNLKKKAEAMCFKEKEAMEKAYGQRRAADMAVASIQSSLSAIQSLLSIERARIDKGLFGSGD